MKGYWVHGLLTRYVRFSFAHPFRVLSTTFLLGVVFTLLSGRLEFRGSFLELLPQSTREVKDFTWVGRKAGGDGYLVLQVLGGNVEARRRFADALVDRLERLAEVRYVEYRYPMEFFRT